MIRVSWPLMQRLGIVAAGSSTAASASGASFTVANFLTGVGLGFLLDDDDDASAAQVAQVIFFTVGLLGVGVLLLLGWSRLKKSFK